MYFREGYHRQRSSAPSLPLVTQLQWFRVRSQSWESACFKCVWQSFINAPFALIFFMQTVTICQQLLLTQDLHQVQVGRKKWVCSIKPGSLKLCETLLLAPQGTCSSHINILKLSQACQSLGTAVLRSCSASGAPGHGEAVPTALHSS